MDSEPLRVPKVIAGVDVKTLPIDARDGFVLSRIDGLASVDDIADLVGLSREEVHPILERLSQLGVVEWIAPTRADSRSPSQPIMQVASEEPDIELDPLRRQQILEAHGRLDECTHYEILGVGNAAEKSEIRTAYFTLSKQFHPDTVYGKKLGAYKAKMEAVFKRITEAYEVLSRQKRRTDYDAYLSARRQIRAAQESLARGREAADEVGREAAPSSIPAPPTRASSHDDVKRARRQLHARQIAQATGRRPPTPRPPPTQPEGPRDRSSVIRDLARSLKQASDFSVHGRRRADDYFNEALAAERAGDLLAAANAARMAVALRPDDVRIVAECERIERETSAQLAESYEKQAVYEEQNQKWAAAATSWAKVAEGRPHDPAAARRAARALLEASGNLKRARVLAQKAVDLEPHNVDNRVVLGRIYLAAGMKLNAKRELKDAAELDPRNEIVKNLLRDL